MITLTEFILQEERKFKNARGSFTLLLTQIENAAKIITSHVRRNGIVDMKGSAGKNNIYDEDVQKLDVFSNDTIIRTLKESGQVYALGSEELDEIMYVKDHPGEYNVFFDPLDGSSNIDTSVTIGTIFSIYHKSNDVLQPGNKQIAAGYIVYGTNVMFVYSCGYGVNGFTLDPSIGSFLLTHPDMRVPEDGTIYSINEAYDKYYSDSIRNYLQHIKQNKSGYKARYVGSMIADVHRTILKGGIFLHPEHHNKKPLGNLRLMFEVNPLSFIMKQAGGMVTTGRQNPLDVIPESISQKSPIIMGSKKNVEEYLSFVK